MDEKQAVGSTAFEPEPPPGSSRTAVEDGETSGGRRDLLSVAFFVAMSVVAALWHGWVLVAPGSPPGIDTGNWLALGEGLFGQEVRPSSVLYPPVVPLLVSGAVRFFGLTAGVSAVGALSAVAPAVGVFMVLRWGGLGWWATVLAGGLLAASSIGEMAAWGGFPQLLGAPLMLMGLWFLYRWLETGARKAAVLAAAAGAVLLAVSHFVAMFAVLAAMAVVGSRLASTRTGRGLAIRRALLVAGLTGLIALPLVPVYLGLVPAVLGSRSLEPALSALQLGQVPGRFLLIHEFAWPLWLLGLVVAVLAGVFLAGRREDALWAVTVGVLTGISAAFLITREPRVLYEVPMAATLGLGLGIRTMRGVASSWKLLVPRASSAVVVLGFLVMVVTGVPDFPRHREAYGLLDDGTVQGLEWVRDNAPPDSLVAVPSLRNAPLVWWAEAIGQRRTLGQAPQRWLIYPEERRIAAEADRLFRRIVTQFDAGLELARERGVDYLVLPKATVVYAALPLIASDVPIAFENASIAVIDVDP